MTSFARRASLAALAVALVATVAACGDDGTVGDELTETEAAQMLAALSRVYIPSPSAPSPTSGPSLVTTVVVDTTTLTAACPSGGTYMVTTLDSIVVDSEFRFQPHPDTAYVSESSYSGDVLSEAEYLDCAATDGLGSVWTFSSADPGLTLDISMDGSSRSLQLTGQNPSTTSTTNWDGSWGGTLGWSSDGRSGQCSMSIEMHSETTVQLGSPVQSTYTQTGQICGLSVSTTSSVGGG